MKLGRAAGPGGRARPGVLRGYTLFELLVVLVIIAIIVSMATLSIRSRGPLVEIVEAGERLASVMRLASKDAVMRSRQLGVQLSGSGYRFVQLHGQRWAQLPGDAFRQRDFPDSLSASLRIDGVPVLVEALALSEDPDSDEPDFEPQILFLSSGDITPFSLVLEHPETQTVVRLSSDWQNGIVAERVD